MRRRRKTSPGRTITALEQLAQMICQRSNSGRCHCAGSSKDESCSSMRFAALGAYDLVCSASPEWHASIAAARSKGSMLS